MFLSILVYCLTAAVLCFLGCRAAQKNENTLHAMNLWQIISHNWEIILSVLLIAAVAGARWHTGYDHGMYLDQYQNLLNGRSHSMGRERYEWGFVAISRLFAWMHVHHFFYFAFWGLLQASLLYYALRDRRFLLPWVGLNLMLGIYFVEWCNSMRQAVCVCLFVAMVPLIERRTWRHFAVFAIIALAAMLIHRSAALLIPLYLLTFSNPSWGRRRWITIGIFLVCVGLGIYPVWVQPLLEWVVKPLLGLLSYNVYDESGMLQPIIDGTFRNIHFGPARVSLILVDLLVLFYYPRVRRYFSDDRQLHIYFILAFLGMCLENLLMDTSHFILRPTQYLTIFVMIMSAYTLCYLWRNSRRLMALAIAILINSYMFIAVYKAVYMPTAENIPYLYHFFFLPQY